MAQNQLAITEEFLSRHPSLIGVVSPLLRIQCSKQGKSKPSINIPLDSEGFFEDVARFMAEFNYQGEYHNPEHFEDVQRRFEKDLKWLRKKFPSEFGDSDFIKARIASIGHDIVHNAYGKVQPPFALSANDICAYYGFAPNNSKMLTQIIDALNAGITQDNALNKGNRSLITDPHAPIALSEEEMSQIIIDAYLYRNGFDLDFRCEISGMIQSTEFKRSMKEGQPDFKWPRTQLELLTKLADIGNFCDPVDQWLITSTRVNTELPFFTGTSAIDFINEELFFINTYVLPVLDPNNQPEINDVSGSPIPARVPDYYKKAIEEKQKYLLRLREEIESIVYHIENGHEVTESQELQEFKEAIRPALAKTAPQLLDPNMEVPLVARDLVVPEKTTPTIPGLGIARKILGQ